MSAPQPEPAKLECLGCRPETLEGKALVLIGGHVLKKKIELILLSKVVAMDTGTSLRDGGIKGAGQQSSC